MRLCGPQRPGRSQSALSGQSHASAQISPGRLECHPQSLLLLGAACVCKKQPSGPLQPSSYKRIRSSQQGEDSTHASTMKLQFTLQASLKRHMKADSSHRSCDVLNSSHEASYLKNWRSATDTDTAPPPKYCFLSTFRASLLASNAPRPVGYPKIL